MVLPLKPLPIITSIEWLKFCLFTWAFKANLRVVFEVRKKGENGGKTA
jgi:hypothetical protein